MRISTAKIENALLAMNFQSRGLVDLNIWWPAMCKEIADQLFSIVNEEPLQEEHKDARAVLEHLNVKTSKNFRPVDANLKPISERLREPGVTLQGVLTMIDRQCRKWLTDPVMCEYLRPGTLFRKSKFDSYYAARNEFVFDPNNKPATRLRGE